jgi:hypothetical protein
VNNIYGNLLLFRSAPRSREASPKNPKSFFLETSMSTNRDKDRASLCSFSFTDGRRCLSPRRNSHSHLCAFHARKEAQARAGQEAAPAQIADQPGASEPSSPKCESNSAQTADKICKSL